MLHLTQQIAPAGPLVECYVAVSQPRQDALRRANLRIPAPILVSALVDTGASCTCVDTRIVRHLGLSPLRTTRLLHPSRGATHSTCGVYDAAIHIVFDEDSSAPFDPIEVVETHITTHGFDLILGGNVLRRAKLVYDGPRNRFTLSI